MALSALPRLAALLEPFNSAAVARRLKRPRGFVVRLRAGQPLRDLSVLADLARMLNLSTANLAAIVAADAEAHRKERRGAAPGSPTGPDRALGATNVLDSRIAAKPHRT